MLVPPMLRPRTAHPRAERPEPAAAVPQRTRRSGPSAGANARHAVRLRRLRSLAARRLPSGPARALRRRPPPRVATAGARRRGCSILSGAPKTGTCSRGKGRDPEPQCGGASGQSTIGRGQTPVFAALVRFTSPIPAVSAACRRPSMPNFADRKRAEPRAVPHPRRTSFGATGTVDHMPEYDWIGGRGNGCSAMDASACEGGDEKRVAAVGSRPFFAIFSTWKAPRSAYACAGRPSNVNFGPFAFIFEYVGREMTREGPVCQMVTRGYGGRPW